MSPDLPELATIDLDGPVRYRAWEGPPDATFVLIHGLGGSHLNWLQVAPGLAGLGSVFALDLPGFGWSPRDGRGSGLMDERRIVSRFIAERGTGRVVVAGHSMGGVIAMLQAAVEPSSVAGLVLTASALPWTKGGFPHPAVMGAFALYDTPGLGDRFARLRMRRMDPEQVVRFGYRMVMADPSSLPGGDRSDERRPGAGTAGRPGCARCVPGCGAVDAPAGEAAAGVGTCARRASDAPSSCCTVAGIGSCPAAFAEAVLAAHPTWRGRIFPDLGHAPQLEAPGRWLAEVADWYAETVR